MKLLERLVRVTLVCTIMCGIAPGVTPLAVGSRSPRTHAKAKAKAKAKVQVPSRRGKRNTSSSSRHNANGTNNNNNKEETLCDYTGEFPSSRSSSDATDGTVVVVPDGPAAAAVTHTMVLDALRQAELPLSASRASVLPKGTPAVRQACLGLVGTRHPQRSASTKTVPRLMHLLTSYFEGPHGPGPHLLHDFSYTSIQLNSNYAAKEHVDFNNLGPSLMIALGNFTSGTGRLHYKGASHVVKESWLAFDGRELHSVESFSNDCERYSLVFFCNGAYLKSKPGELEALGQRGLRVAPLLKQQQQEQAQLGSTTTVSMFPSPTETRLELDHHVASREGRVLLVRGLAKGCQTTSSRSDLATFADQVTRYVATCLEQERIGTVHSCGSGNHPTNTNTVEPPLPLFEMRLHSNGNPVRVRAANTCFVVAPTKHDADAAADALQVASDHRLVVEAYRPPPL